MVFAQRLVIKVHVHPARERIGDDKGRRGEIVGPHLRMNAALEVSVAGKHRTGHEVAFLDTGGDRFAQRPRVADASRTAVANKIKAQLLQFR